jgi:hypothetical protein
MDFRPDEWSAATQRIKFKRRFVRADVIEAASLGGYPRLYSDLYHAVLIAVMRPTLSQSLPQDPVTE